MMAQDGSTLRGGRRRVAPPYVVVGCGALGRSYAIGLASAGIPTTLVGTPGSVAAIRAVGTLRLRGELTVEVPVAAPDDPDGGVVVTDALSTIGDARGMLFATKLQDLRAAAEAAAHCRVAWVSGVQNGVGKNRVLSEVFRSSEVVGAAGTLAAERQDDGDVVVGNRGMSYFGSPARPDSDSLDTLVAALDQSGLPATSTPEIASIEWSKTCNVAGAFAIDMITAASWSEAMENRELTRVFLSVVREVAVIARAEGVEVADYPGFPAWTYVTRPDETSIAMRAERVQAMRTAGQAVDRRSSLRQDLERGRPTEFTAIFDDLLERALRRGVDVPRLSLVSALGRFLEDARPAKQSGRLQMAGH